MIAMTATLTLEELKSIPKTLGMKIFRLVSANPDRLNIKLSKIHKTSNTVSTNSYEIIYESEIRKLYELEENYPVTLMYMPMFFMGPAAMLAKELCPCAVNDIYDSKFGILFSKQDDVVTNEITSQLKSDHPRIRLVFCTNVVGVGFDGGSISRVVHTRPPRNINDYVQEIGRAGRRNQEAEAVLYWNARDMASNVPGISGDIITYCKSEDCCLRKRLLSFYGYEPNVNAFKTICACCSFCELSCDCSKHVK